MERNCGVLWSGEGLPGSILWLLYFSEPIAPTVPELRWGVPAWTGERRAGTGSEQGRAPAGGDRQQRWAASGGRARHDPAFVYGGEGGKGRSAEGRRPGPARGAAP